MYINWIDIIVIVIGFIWLHNSNAKAINKLYDRIQKIEEELNLKEEDK